jgi:AcrR family transcriptional regulator
MPYHHGNLREALLERAAEIIAREGVGSVSLRGLARDLGVSHAAPRRHFADRSELLAALAQEGFERSMQAMLAGAEQVGPDPVARYRALGRAYVRFAVEHPSYFKAINHPEVRALAHAELQAARREWLGILRDGAEAAREAGWHPGVRAEVLVAFSIAAATGAAELFASEIGIDVIDPAEDLEKLADDVLDLVVRRTP